MCSQIVILTGWITNSFPDWRSHLFIRSTNIHYFHLLEGETDCDLREFSLVHTHAYTMHMHMHHTFSSPFQLSIWGSFSSMALNAWLSQVSATPNSEFTWNQVPTPSPVLQRAPLFCHMENPCSPEFPFLEERESKWGCPFRTWQPGAPQLPPHKKQGHSRSSWICPGNEILCFAFKPTLLYVNKGKSQEHHAGQEEHVSKWYPQYTL